MYYKGVGGRAVFGFLMGIISNKTSYIRVPGDSGNVSSYPFPMMIEPVNQPILRIVEKDPELLKEYTQVIRKFEEYGVKAITTVCGFNVVFQEELARASKVPIFSSSLMQLPIVHKMLPQGRQIGIMTADGRIFRKYKEELLRCAGMDPATPIAISKLEDQPAWSLLLQGKPFLDQEQIERDVVAGAKEMVCANPEIGAFVFECHNLPPYGKAVQDATGLAVFDVMTLVDMVYKALVRERYTGIV